MDKGNNDGQTTGYNDNTNHIVDPELQRLFYRRARAKYGVDLEIEYVTPLIVAGYMKALGLVSRIDDSIKEMQSHLEDLELAHREYIKRI